MTSSGLSHTQKSNPPFYGQEKNWNLITIDNFVASRPFLDLNYGVLEIPIHRTDSNDDIVVNANIKGIDGRIALSKSYSVLDLAWKNSNLRFQNQCKVRLEKQRIFDNLVHWSKLIFKDLDWHPLFMLFMLGQISFVFTLLSSIFMIRFIVKQVSKML